MVQQKVHTLFCWLAFCRGDTTLGAPSATKILQIRIQAGQYLGGTMSPVRFMIPFKLCPWIKSRETRMHSRPQHSRPAASRDFESVFKDPVLLQACTAEAKKIKNRRTPDAIHGSGPKDASPSTKYAASFEFISRIKLVLTSLWRSFVLLRGAKAFFFLAADAAAATGSLGTDRGLMSMVTGGLSDPASHSSDVCDGCPDAHGGKRSSWKASDCRHGRSGNRDG